MKAAIESTSDLQNSCITILGCPAEEGEGGKIEMIENGQFTPLLTDTCTHMHNTIQHIAREKELPQEDLSLSHTHTHTHTYTTFSTAGCFEGVDCALMVHPFTQSAVVINALARSYHRVVFTSLQHTSDQSSLTSDPVHLTPPTATPTKSTSDPVHLTPPTTTPTKSTSDPVHLTPPTTTPTKSTSDPNPLDAAILAYTSLSMLRQQLKPSWMIHGVITKGGTHPGITPTHTEMLYYFRAPTYAELIALQARGRDCFESAALATGCAVTITEKARTYKDVVSNPSLVELFLQNSRKLGVEFSKSTQNFSASTDMGNVSHVVPSIHPVYGIGTTAGLHTREYADSANTSIAHRSTLLAAQVVALTAIDIISQPHILEQIKTDFNLSQITPYPQK